MACGKSAINHAIVPVGQTVDNRRNLAMDHGNDAYIKLLNGAIQIAAAWGLSVTETANLLGVEMPREQDKIDWSEAVTAFRIFDVEERALKIFELKTALNELYKDETQRTKIGEPQKALEGKSLRDLLITGKREDFDEAIGSIMFLMGG